MAETGASTARTTWSYDAAYQLTGEHRTGANAFRNTFTYDNRGNRLLKNLDGTRTTSSYDDANQLRWTQDGSGRTTYTFDADGNQQVTLTPAGQRTTSLWDYENKLTGVLQPSGARETMAYDPEGKRLQYQTATETAKYVWDHENYLQEADASNVTQATYTNEPRSYGNLISQRKSGATHYYVFDALGSTRLLTNSSEAVSESLLYDAWGNLITAAPSMAVPFRWVGELGYLFVPSTADYYVRARTYRPSIGRWSTKDPLQYAFSDGNTYWYASNRVFVSTDATGLQDDTPASATQPPSTREELSPAGYIAPAVVLLLLRRIALATNCGNSLADLFDLVGEHAPTISCGTKVGIVDVQGDWREADPPSIGARTAILVLNSRLNEAGLNGDLVRFDRLPRSYNIVTPCDDGNSCCPIFKVYTRIRAHFRGLLTISNLIGELVTFTFPMYAYLDQFQTFGICVPEGCPCPPEEKEPINVQNNLRLPDSFPIRIQLLQHILGGVPCE